MNKRIIFLLSNTFLITNVFCNISQVQILKENHEVLHVVNGKDAEKNKYDWFGIVKPKKNSKITQVDGAGTLISDRWVLTAGHVAWHFTVKLKQKIEVSFGVYDLNDDQNKNSYDVEKVIFHPDYKDKSLLYESCDLALLYLSKPVKNIKPIRMLTTNEKSTQNTFSTVLGFGVNGVKGESWTDPAKLQEADLEIQDPDKIKEKFGDETWFANGFNYETDLIAGTIFGKRISAAQGDSGGPLTKTIDNEQVLIGVVKCGSRKIENFWSPSPSVFVDVGKTFNWTTSIIQTKTTNQILNYYHHTSYKDIFQDKLNPQEVYSMNDAKITYDWKGSYGSPTWGKLRYRFDGSYAFLIYMYIRQNEKFISYIKNWVQKGQLTNNMKMEVLYHLVFKTLFVNFNDIRSLYWFKDVAKHFSGFMNHFFGYFDLKKNRYHKVIKSSLFYKVLYMGKTKDALWVDNYLEKDSKYEPDSWNLEHDQTYDAGLNFFIDFHSKNPGILADILLKGSTWSYPVFAKDKNDPFKRPKEIISERTSGAENYLSWIDYNNGNPIKRFHRPGKNIYVHDEI